MGFAEKLDDIISEAEEVATDMYGESQTPQDQQVRQGAEGSKARTDTMSSHMYSNVVHYICVKTNDFAVNS